MQHSLKGRFLTVLAVLTAVLLIASGCSTQSQSPTLAPSTTTAASSAEVKQTAAATEPANPFADNVTITVATFDIPPTAENSDVFTTEGQKYYDPRWKIIGDKFNVRVAFRAYDYATHQDQLRTMIAADDMPDAMISTLGIGEYKKYVADGLLKVLPAGYESNYPNIKVSLDMILQRDAYKTDDGQYFAIPRALEGAEPYIDYQQSIYYRKDLAAAAGVTLKDAYTVDELYGMFEKVQAANAEMTMYNHIWPNSVLQLGLVEAVPQIVTGGFYLDKASNKYVYAYQNPRMVDGIKAFKKFYDAGFINKEFYSLPMYEARNQFSNNQLFCYFDGFDVLFFDQALNNYKKSNPNADVNAAIGFAWLLDNDGNLQGIQSGNSWSEWIFNAKIEQKVLDRFLSLFDYLVGDEGLKMSNLGQEGIDYKVEGDKYVSLRKIDPATGTPIPFNSDKTVRDIVTPFITGALADSRVNAINPAYSDYAKQTVKKYWDLRKSASNLKVLEFNLALSSFSGEYYSKSTLKPVEAIYKIIYENKPDGVAAAWQKWLEENKQQIDNILNELNTSLVK